jgi:hypothetical protein
MAMRRAARPSRRRRVAGQEGAAQGTHPADRRQAHPRRRRAGVALRPDPRAPRRHVGGVQRALPLRGDRRSALGHRRCAGGPRTRAAHGPAGRGRCGLRQDRGRHARGLRRGGAGVAGGRHRAHDAARAPARQDLPRPVPGLSGQCPATLALRPRERSGGHEEGHGRRLRRYRHRHPRAAGQGHPVQATSGFW